MAGAVEVVAVRCGWYGGRGRTLGSSRGRRDEQKNHHPLAETIQARMVGSWISESFVGREDSYRPAGSPSLQLSLRWL
jgi:hypothetical protein